jgi:hypothetical protein
MFLTNEVAHSYSIVPQQAAGNVPSRIRFKIVAALNVRERKRSNDYRPTSNAPMLYVIFVDT